MVVVQGGIQQQHKSTLSFLPPHGIDGEQHDVTAAKRNIDNRWSFGELNHLVERHNANFPAEARLPMDPRTRDFVKINGRSYQREPLDADWILERWPADLAAARASA